MSRSSRRIAPLDPAIHHLNPNPIKTEHFDNAFVAGLAKLPSATIAFNRNRKDTNLSPLSPNEYYAMKLREYARSFWSIQNISINNSCMMRITIDVSAKSFPNQAHNTAMAQNWLNDILKANRQYQIYSIYYFHHSENNYVNIQALLIFPSRELINIIEELFTLAKRVAAAHGPGNNVKFDPVALTAASLRREAEDICHCATGSASARAAGVDAAIRAHAIAKTISGIKVRGRVPMRLR